MNLHDEDSGSPLWVGMLPLWPLGGRLGSAHRCYYGCSRRVPWTGTWSVYCGFSSGVLGGATITAGDRALWAGTEGLLGSLLAGSCKGYYSCWEWGTPGSMGLGVLQPKVDWEEKWSLPKSHTTLTLILLEFALRIFPREFVSQAQAADSSTGLEPTGATVGLGGWDCAVPLC